MVWNTQFKSLVILQALKGVLFCSYYDQIKLLWNCKMIFIDSDHEMLFY